MATNEAQVQQGSRSEVQKLADREKRKYERKAAFNIAKSGGQIAMQGLRTVATTAFSFASGSLGPIIAAAVVLIILILVIVMIITIVTGSPTTKAGTPPTPSSGGLTASCDASGDPAAAIKTNFNATVTGTNDKDQLALICNILSIPGASQTYLDLLSSAGPTSIAVIGGGLCYGYVASARHIELHGFFTQCQQYATRRYILIHETGHIIAIGHGRLYQTFRSTAYYPHDPSCYVRYSGNGEYYLSTYPLSAVSSIGSGGGGGGLSESFAESLADYVLNKPPLENYPTKCSVGYNWESANIFGGTTF